MDADYSCLLLSQPLPGCPGDGGRGLGRWTRTTPACSSRRRSRAVPGMAAGVWTDGRGLLLPAPLAAAPGLSRGLLQRTGSPLLDVGCSWLQRLHWLLLSATYPTRTLLSHLPPLLLYLPPASSLLSPGLVDVGGTGWQSDGRVLQLSGGVTGLLHPNEPLGWPKGLLHPGGISLWNPNSGTPSQGPDEEASPDTTSFSPPSLPPSSPLPHARTKLCSVTLLCTPSRIVDQTPPPDGRGGAGAFRVWAHTAWSALVGLAG